MDFQPGASPHGGCDGCPGQELVKNEFVTKDNICSLFDKYHVPTDFELLTIDVPRAPCSSPG